MTPIRLSLSTIEPDHPIGPILAVSNGEALIALEFDSADGRLRQILKPRYGRDIVFEARDCPSHIVSAIRAYFDGKLDAIDISRSIRAARLSSRRSGEPCAASRRA